MNQLMVLIEGGAILIRWSCLTVAAAIGILFVLFIVTCRTM